MVLTVLLGILEAAQVLGLYHEIAAANFRDVVKLASAGLGVLLSHISDVIVTVIARRLCSEVIRADAWSRIFAAGCLDSRP